MGAGNLIGRRAFIGSLGALTGCAITQRKATTLSTVDTLISELCALRDEAARVPVLEADLVARDAQITDLQQQLADCQATDPTDPSGPTPYTLPAVIEDSGWSWWCEPRAVRRGSALHVGHITSAGTVLASTIDPATGLSTVELGQSPSIDEHNPPAFTDDPTRPLVAFWAGHNDNATVYYRKADAAGVFGQTRTISFSSIGSQVSYVQVLTNGAHIFVLCRVQNRYWAAVRSTDWGETWGSPHIWLDFGSGNQGYVTMCRHNAHPHLYRIALYGHPSISPTPIRYGYVMLDTLAIQRPGNVDLGNLLSGSATSPGGYQLAHAPAAGKGCRLFGVSTLDGKPAIAFAEWSNDDDARYYIARYADQSSPFDAVELCSAGAVIGHNPAAHYHGGLTMPTPAADGGVWLAREDVGTWTVEKWATPDAGASWTLDEVVESSTTTLARPTLASGAGGDVEAVYERIHTYSSYESWLADLVAV